MTEDVDAAVARFLAGDAAELRRRQDLRTAIELWGLSDVPPPPAPFGKARKADPDATRPPVRPAAQPDTGNANRHRMRWNAAKSRH